jgi:lipoprotein-anchoring transpeptidase ErfK/SrfK
MRKYIILFSLVLMSVAWFLFIRFSSVTVKQLDESGAVKITINFYIPVRQEDIDDKVQFISERPGTNIIRSSRWVDSKTLEIFAVEKDLPKGFNTKLYVGPLRTSIPGLYKVVKANYQVSIPPFLTGISPIAPGSGPIILDFSTPINMENLKKGLITDFEYTLRQGHIVNADGQLFRDYSRVEVVPKQRLVPGKKYEIKFDGLVSNFKDDFEKIGFHRVFQVAEIPNVTRTSPVDGDKDVKLYDLIVVKFHEEMKEVDIQVQNMTGDVKIDGKTATFKPHTVFMPGQTYRVKVTGKSIFNEEMKPYTFEFSTVDMKDKWWVEINLRPIQKVTVYRGNKVIRSMVASAGLPDSENRTPQGFFYLKDRGEYFWTERIQEGGLYWVRITDNYLIHSVPRNKDNEIIEEEFKKLGIPASHGCVRLKDEYAKWFYETVPIGTLVIIHD